MDIELEILKLIDKNVEQGKMICLRDPDKKDCLNLFENIQDLEELLIKEYGRSKS